MALDYNKLKKQVDAYKQQADKAQGALDRLKQELKEEFGCTTLKQAKKKLDELQQKQTAAEKRFDDLLDQFLQEWGEKLSLGDDRRGERTTKDSPGERLRRRKARESKTRGE